VLGKEHGQGQLKEVLATDQVKLGHGNILSEDFNSWIHGNEAASKIVSSP
jgi:hypothetical protein